MPQLFKHPIVRNVPLVAAGIAVLALLASLEAQTGSPRSRKTTSRKTSNTTTTNTNPTAGTRDAGPQIPGWNLKFQEEFEGNGLNYSKWSPHPPATAGWGSLVDAPDWTPEAVSVSGGQAHIAARLAASGINSGVITTVGTFAQTYGRFEIRCRMPAGAGLEPLFQLLPVPSGELPEIDAAHSLGSDPATALFGNRWRGERTERSYTGKYGVGDLSNGFHVIAVEWDADQIVWLVDGVERFHSYEGVPHQPMYMAISLGVGGGTTRPGIFDIDYVRVYARS